MRNDSKEDLKRIEKFRLDVAGYSTEAGKNDAALLLLINPTLSELQQATKSALSENRFRLDISGEFGGFRAIKLYNPTSGASRCIVWPSFCWTHGGVVAAAKRTFTDFIVVEKETRHNFDRGPKGGFSEEAFKAIMDWMRKVRTEPETGKSVREE